MSFNLIVSALDANFGKRLASANTQLHESEEKLVSILATTENAIWSITADTYETLYLNLAAERIYGRGFFYGWVEYSDLFNATTRRRTEYCAEIQVNGEPRIKPERGAASGLSFAVAGKYNGIDDDCFYKPGTRPPVGGLPPIAQPPPDAEIIL